MSEQLTGAHRKQVMQAARRFADFHGFDAREVEFLNRALPEVFFCLGEAVSIAYRVVEGRKYVYYNHEFETPAALAISFDGKSALMPGGAWRFTDRGFIG